MLKCRPVVPIGVGRRGVGRDNNTRRRLPRSTSPLVGDRFPHHLGPLDDQLRRPILL
jgi:hypothetical protein